MVNGGARDFHRRELHAADHAPAEDGEWRDPSAGGQPGRGRRPLAEGRGRAPAAGLA